MKTQLVTVSPKEILSEIDDIIYSFIEADNQHMEKWKKVQKDIMNKTKENKPVVMRLKNIAYVIKHAQMSRASTRVNMIRFEMEMYEMLGLPIPKRYETELNLLFARLLISPFKEKAALLSQMRKQFIMNDEKNNFHQMNLECECERCMRKISVHAKPFLDMIKKIGTFDKKSISVFLRLYNSLNDKIKNGMISVTSSMIYEVVKKHQETLALERVETIRFEMKFCMLIERKPSHLMLAEYDMITNDITDKLIQAKMKNMKEILCVKVGM